MTNETSHLPNNNGISLWHKTFLLSAIGASAICLTLLAVADRSTPPAISEQSSASRTGEEPAPSPADRDPYENLALEAKAVHVFDVNTGETIYAKNADQALPLASITKVMTAFAAAEVLSDSARVTVNTEALSEEGDSGLQAGETWLSKRLRDFTLVVSSNDGAHALAAAASASLSRQNNPQIHDTVSLMDLKAQELELTSLKFHNETGLDVDTQTAGGYGSAHDVSQLVAHVLRTDAALLEATANPTFTTHNEQSTPITVVNTNPIVGRIPGLLASKTGFSDLAGGNLVIAFDVGLQRPIIITVLGSSYEGRFTDMEKLVAATTEALRSLAVN